MHLDLPLCMYISVNLYVYACVFVCVCILCAFVCVCINVLTMCYSVFTVGTKAVKQLLLLVLLS